MGKMGCFRSGVQVMVLGLALLVGCQKSSVDTVIQGEVAPAQLDLKVRYVGDFDRQGKTGVQADQLGGIYRDAGSLDFIVFEIENRSSEPVALHPGILADPARTAVELHARSSGSRPRGAPISSDLGGGPTIVYSYEESSSVTRSEFYVESAVLHFASGGEVALSLNEGIQGHPTEQFIRFRANETAQLRLRLRLRAGFEVVVSDPLPEPIRGYQTIKFFPPGSARDLDWLYRTETLDDWRVQLQEFPKLWVYMENSQAIHSLYLGDLLQEAHQWRSLGIHAERRMKQSDGLTYEQFRQKFNGLPVFIL